MYHFGIVLLKNVSAKQMILLKSVLREIWLTSYYIENNAGRQNPQNEFSFHLNVTIVITISL